MKSKRSQKVLSLLLVFLLVLQSLPLRASAAEAIQASTSRENQENPPPLQTECDDVTVIGEDKTLRDAYTKHFRNSDGSFTAAVYAQPVHYLKDGSWEDIDMCLISSETQTVSDEKQTATKTVYRTAATDTPITFPQQFTADDYVTVSNRGYELRFKPITVNATAVTGEFGSTRNEGLLRASTTQKDTALLAKTGSSSVRYGEIYPSADLYYEVSAGRLKESIVVKAMQDTYVYRFLIETDGLNGVQNADGSVSLFAPDESETPVYVIARPYMFDAAGEQSDSVVQTFEQNGNTAVLTVTADSRWINSRERVFPVTVDPTLIMDVGVSRTDDTYVNSAQPNTPLPNDYYLYIGKNSLGTTRTYVKFYLPDLPDCSVVMNAELALAQNQYDPGTGAAAWITVSTLASDWNIQSVTWNNQPPVDENIGTVDYTAFKSGTGAYNYTLNITKIVKQWYEYGNNYGLMLKSYNEATTKRSRFYSTNYGSGYPVFQMTYVNNTGLEDYWQYETVDLGVSGSIYVNSYNGALTYVHNDISLGGNILPMSLSHIFNSDEVSTQPVLGGNVSYGSGFRLNISEKISRLATTHELYDDNYRFKLVDSDGTVHYFLATNTANTYEYEFDENIVLRYVGSQEGGTYYFTLTYEDGSKRYYSLYGYLVRLTDPNGNTMSVSIDSNSKALTVTDGAGRVLTLNYQNNKLSSVSVPSGSDAPRTVGYTYDAAGNLTVITYQDGTATKLFYDTNGMLTRVLAADASDLLISYKAVTSHSKTYYRVSSLTRRGTGDSETAARDVYKTLSFTYRGSDTLIEDAQNGESVCVGFDNAGRAVSARNQEGDLAVSAYNSEGNLNNTIAYSSDSFRFADNLLQNSSFEKDDTTWNYYISGSSGYSFTTLSEGAYSGNRTIALTRSVAGSILINQNYDDVTPGAEYTFSAYFKIVEALTSGKFAVSIEVYNGNTRLFTERSMDYTVTDGWERVQVSAVLPENATRIRVYAFLDSSAVGTVLVDACQLEQSGAAGQYNLLQNPGMMRTDTDGSLADWTGTGTTALIANSALNGNAVRLTGTPSSDSAVYQDVAVSGTAGTTLVFGATAKGFAASGNPTDANDKPTRHYCIEVTLYNGSETVATETAAYNLFAIGTEQALVASVKAESDFTSVRFKLLYGKQINTALFDNTYLYVDTFGTSYKYDDNGKLILAENDNGDAIGYTYNGPDLTKISYQKDGVEYDGIDYEYEDKTHNLLTATTKSGIVTTYTYPTGNANRGLPDKVTVKNADGTLQSSVSYAYTPDYNYLLSETDALGNIVTYEYNTYLGINTAVIDAEGNKTQYNYNTTTDLLTSVSTEVNGTSIANTYTYNDQKQLSSVSHNGFSYGFTYDDFGRPLTTSVAGQILGIYNYNPDGTLLAMVYGNGVLHSYSYDSLDRITGESYNGTETYTYHYNAAGQLGRHEDYENNVTWLYGYDLVGRLTDVQGTDGTRLSYAYDEHNNIQSYTAKKNGTTLSAASYTYTDEGLPVSAELNAEFSDYSHSYDSLNRLTELTHDVNGDTVRTIYTYKDGTEDGTTTGQVNYVSYRYGYFSFGPYPDQYYSYDANGNIVETSNGAMQIFYTYDALNRLVREDNELLNKSFTYEYDVGGNILNKKEYAYTTEELGTPTDTIVYTYDTVWKDKLLTYDGGETITYDNIGNPLTYNGYTFTWQKGRQLASASGNGDTITYKYGADGLRTQKTVNGVTTEYTYASGLLVSQTDGTNTLNFSYTADGVARSVNYNGTDYYYLYNLQGDVVAIYDRGGNPMVHYTYDTWGKVVNITGTLKNTLGTLNPFRYRGYYYDTETGLYYVSSRYYDPEIGRWISPEPNVYAGAFDSGSGLIGYNVYAYCANNPVYYYDPTGEFVISTLLICVAAGAIIGGTIGGIAGNAYANSKGYTGWNKTKSILTGIGIGGLAGGALGYFAAPAVVSATGVAGISITSGGISTIAALGTSFGKLGTLIANNGQQIIDWGKTTWHGMQRMIERGVTQNMVEVWAKTGKALQQAGDKILYITKQGAVVIDKAGKVITAYTSQYFDPAMQEVVEKLFGK